MMRNYRIINIFSIENSEQNGCHHQWHQKLIEKYICSCSTQQDLFDEKDCFLVNIDKNGSSINRSKLTDLNRYNTPIELSISNMGLSISPKKYRNNRKYRSLEPISELHAVLENRNRRQLELAFKVMLVQWLRMELGFCGYKSKYQIGPFNGFRWIW